MFKRLRSGPLSVVLVVFGIAFSTGCGSGAGGGSGGNSLPGRLASVEVRPNSTTIAVGDSGKQFSADPKDDAGNVISNEEIFWEIMNNDGRRGSVNATGWYRPPTVLPDSSNVALVTAYSRKDPAKVGFASVTLLTGAHLSFAGNTRVADHAIGDDGNGFGRQNIAVLDRTVYMVWADNPIGPGGNYDIYFAKSPDRGKTFLCQSRLQLDKDQLSPSIAVDGQGNVYITAYDNSIGSNYGIFFVKGEPNSSGCMDFVQQSVIFSSFSEAYFSPSIAISPDGNAYMAWTWEDSTSSGVYFAKGAPSDQTQEIIFDPTVLVKIESTATVFYNDVGISVGSDGKIYIVYSRTDSQDSEILLARSSDQGLSFQEVTVNDQTYSIYPAMAVGQSGSVYVAWTDFRSAQPKVYVARSTDGGQSFPDRFEALANLQGEQWLPGLSVDQAENIYLAWENVDSAGDGDIYFAKSVDRGASFGAPIRVNNDTGTTAQSSPTLTLDSAGRAFLLWFDERDATPSLYLAVGQ
jgi:hypothetical protein